jgi:aryl-alcohol dehydrogenase-like predicted oxidoreductase
LQLAERLDAVGKRHGRTAGEVAIAWTLQHPAVTGAIVGARNAKQVEGIIGGSEIELSSQEVAEIEAL